MSLLSISTPDTTIFNLRSGSHSKCKLLAASVYYKWSKVFLEAGKNGLMVLSSYVPNAVGPIPVPEPATLLFLAQGFRLSGNSRSPASEEWGLHHRLQRLHDHGPALVWGEERLVQILRQSKLKMGLCATACSPAFLPSKCPFFIRKSVQPAYNPTTHYLPIRQKSPYHKCFSISKL